MPYVLAERGHKYPAADSREHVRRRSWREGGRKVRTRSSMHAEIWVAGGSASGCMRGRTPEWLPKWGRVGYMAARLAGGIALGPRL